MLTDLALKRLKPQEKTYKVADRDGMYAAVSPTGQIAFRYDYRLHGRRETLTFGKYGPGGLSLAEARERCMIARKLVAEGEVACAGKAAREAARIGRTQFRRGRCSLL